MATKTLCGICGTDCSGPGKFEGNECQVLAQALYAVTMDSGQDEEIGECDGPMGWNALIIGSVPEDSDKSAGYIVSESSQGYFDYEPFQTESEARRIWDKLVTEYETQMAESETDE